MSQNFWVKTETICSQYKLFWTKSKCFAFVDILSMRVFCRREYFVVVRTLSMRDFVDASIKSTWEFLDANILLTPIFCWRVYFVNANNLLPHIFYQHQHFVDAVILSMPTYCRRDYFVDARILSTRVICRHQYFLSTWTFCWRQYFVGSNILSPQIFVGANILSPPMFCLCLG